METWLEIKHKNISSRLQISYWLIISLPDFSVTVGLSSIPTSAVRGRHDENNRQVGTWGGQPYLNTTHAPCPHSLPPLPPLPPNLPTPSPALHTAPDNLRRRGSMPMVKFGP